MLKTILHLIPKHPAIKVLIVGDDTSRYYEEISEHLFGVGGSADIAGLSESSIAKLKSREYEIAVITVKDDNANTFKIMKKIYTSLENSGIAILLVDEKQSSDTVTLLEKCDYRSPNVIEMIDGIACIVAKKLHMWGNGL